MIIGISNTPRDYAWGSVDAIPALLGTPVTGEPQAELWLGAHPGSPSIVAGGDPDSPPVTLDRLLRAEPEALSGRPALPFLLKILAAAAPLSLQVHPTDEQAAAGFARENESGVPIDAPERDYKDASAKPELIVAVSPTFDALAGFRDVSESRSMLNELIAGASGDDRVVLRTFADSLAGDPEQALRGAVEQLLRRDAGPLVDAVVRSSTAMPAVSSFAREWATVADLATRYPGDPGVVIALLLNRVTLNQGEALALPAGNVHAYLAGLGVELMAASDNVLRGGLTTKHVDVDELLAVATFAPLPAPLLLPERPAAGLRVFRPAEGDFVLVEAEIGDAAEDHGYTNRGEDEVVVPITGPTVLVVTAGGVTVSGARDTLWLARGDAAFVSADESPLTVSGSGVAFIATTK